MYRGLVAYSIARLFDALSYVCAVHVTNDIIYDNESGRQYGTYFGCTERTHDDCDAALGQRSQYRSRWRGKCIVCQYYVVEKGYLEMKGTERDVE